MSIKAWLAEVHDGYDVYCAEYIKETKEGMRIHLAVTKSLPVTPEIIHDAMEAMVIKVFESTAQGTLEE